MDAKKNIKLVSKLNRETKEGQLIWQISRIQPSLNNGENVIDLIYYTEVNNKTLRLYKYSTKYYMDEDTFEWTTSIRLEFVDRNWKSQYAFPEIAILSDLYETVRYKTSGLDDFLENYLDGEEEEEDDLPF
jgi:hypothetical protein